MSTRPTGEQLANGVKTGANLLLQALSAPFPVSEIRFKPQSVKGNRALAVPYINARCVMDRLDDVVGIDGWQDSYQLLEGGNVSCTIAVRVGEKWIRKTDVGGPSEQPDEGDRMKAAYSDAFKRAAVKFGIGRYIYRCPMQWCDYDPQKRQFVGTPKLPAEFTPADIKPANPPASAPSHVRGSDISSKRIVVAGVERISPAEADKLSGLLGAAKVNVETFLKHYDISTVNYLPSFKYTEAVERLEKKIEEKPRAA